MRNKIIQRIGEIIKDNNGIYIEYERPLRQMNDDALMFVYELLFNQKILNDITKQYDLVKKEN